jgi:hypothetical protein
VTQLATIDDYYAYQGVAVPTLDDTLSLALNSLLTRATDRILRIARTARYTVKSDGTIHPATARDAFRRAVAAQAISMRSGGEEGDAGSAEDWTSVGLIGVEFSRQAGAGTTGVTVIGGTRYSSEAIDILVGAGMFSSRVAHPGG